MKSKEEILKMTKKKLYDYKWSNDLDKEKNIECSYCSDCSGCSDCSYCSNCSGCSGCSDCSNCSGCYNCRNAKNLKYAICNVEMTKEEYEKKMKELSLIK